MADIVTVKLHKQRQGFCLLSTWLRWANWDTSGSAQETGVVMVSGCEVSQPSSSDMVTEEREGLRTTVWPNKICLETISYNFIRFIWRPWDKYLRCIYLTAASQQPYRSVWLSFPFYRWRNWGPEASNNLSTVPLIIIRTDRNPSKLTPELILSTALILSPTWMIAGGVWGGREEQNQTPELPSSKACAYSKYSIRVVTWVWLTHLSLHKSIGPGSEHLSPLTHTLTPCFERLPFVHVSLQRVLWGLWARGFGEPRDKVSGLPPHGSTSEELLALAGEAYNLSEQPGSNPWIPGLGSSLEGGPLFMQRFKSQPDLGLALASPDPTSSATVWY